MFLAGAAAAAPLVKPPPGWTGGADPELVAQTGELSHFGGVHGVIEAERWTAPRPGVVLYVTRIAANLSTPREAALRAELDSLAPSQLATPGVEHQSHELADPATRALEATESSRDPSSHVVVTKRMVIAGTPDRVVAVTGECTAADDAEAELLSACKAALATIDPDVAARDRIALGVPRGGTQAPPPAQVSTLAPEASRMDDGSRATLPPMVIPQAAPPADRRPLVVGAGIVVLAAAFWWNRRRRARFEKELSDDR